MTKCISKFVDRIKDTTDKRSAPPRRARRTFDDLPALTRVPRPAAHAPPPRRHPQARKHFFGRGQPGGQGQPRLRPVPYGYYYAGTWVEPGDRVVVQEPMTHDVDEDEVVWFAPRRGCKSRAPAESEQTPAAAPAMYHAVVRAGTPWVAFEAPWLDYDPAVPAPAVDVARLRELEACDGAASELDLDGLFVPAEELAKQADDSWVRFADISELALPERLIDWLAGQRATQ
ncbi:hypothetical protein Q5752_004831 [Cryptotrichosporon argae]